MSDVIGFVGLGAMGTGMAKNLIHAGHPLRVYNRDAEKTKPLIELGAERSETPGGAARAGGVVVTMLANDEAVESVTTGPSGLLEALGKGGIHVSMSTVSPDLARRLAKMHEERGQQYIAAPVFGKPDAAAAAKLFIAVSGSSDAARQRVRPLLDAMSQGVYDFGDDAGAANIVKLAGNFMLGAAIEAMAEAFTLAEKNGIARTDVHDLFSNTIFACPIYKNYGKLIAEQQYEPIGARPSLIRKDLGLVLDVAKDSQVPMPLASLVHDRLTATVARGRDDKDWAGFAREVSDAAGLPSGE
jgi:3-hydroxyisobutyrate dehydrogenase-like beta-hydroxyacid dehydrogenase